MALPQELLAAVPDKKGKKEGKKSAKAVAAKSNILGRNLVPLDPDTKAGIEALYSLENDKAIAAFGVTVKRYPHDAFALNHLLQALLLKELFRLNALDTTLYADNGFLTGKPLPGDPEVKKKILALSQQAMELSDARIKENSEDAEALYARGVTRGLRLSYIALVEKSFFPSLKAAIGSRNDHERVLELDPGYMDAKLVVGVHNFIVGSMPLAARIMAGIIGVHGDKKKGIALLDEVGKAKCETSADARAALALFLRREAKYAEALAVIKTLTEEYPRNFIFALEQANLMKDAGMGEQAVTEYADVVKKAKAGSFPAMHIDRAYFGLAEALKGQRRAGEALDAYNAALDQRDTAPDLRVRALLGAGQMLDVLSKREGALQQYQEVLALAPDSEQAALARAYIKQAFKYPS